MPVYYSGIMDEHLAVRTAAGIFDISHMGEVTVSGAAAEEFVRSAWEISKLRENVPAAMRASFENLPTVRDVLARTGPGDGRR